MKKRIILSMALTMFALTTFAAERPYERAFPSLPKKNNSIAYQTSDKKSHNESLTHEQILKTKTKDKKNKQMEMAVKSGLLCMGIGFNYITRALTYDFLIPKNCSPDHIDNLPLPYHLTANMAVFTGICLLHKTASSLSEESKSFIHAFMTGFTAPSVIDIYKRIT